MLPGLPKMHRIPSGAQHFENHAASGNLFHQSSRHASVPKRREVASETMLPVSGPAVRGNSLTLTPKVIRC